MPKSRQNNSRGSIVLMFIGALLILGALGWYVFVISGQPGSNAKADAPSSGGAADNYPQIERVSAEDAKTAYDQSQAVFLDVRNVEEYTQGHITGAVNIPLLDMPTRIGELDPNIWIITY